MQLLVWLVRKLRCLKPRYCRICGKRLPIPSFPEALDVCQDGVEGEEPWVYPVGKCLDAYALQRDAYWKAVFEVLGWTQSK